MRLIDADAMIKRNKHSIYDTTDLKEMLDYEPTAYDVDKVIEKLVDGLDEIMYERCYSPDYELGMKCVKELLQKVFIIE